MAVGDFAMLANDGALGGDPGGNRPCFEAKDGASYSLSTWAYKCDLHIKYGGRLLILDKSAALWLRDELNKLLPQDQLSGDV